MKMFKKLLKELKRPGWKFFRSFRKRRREEIETKIVQGLEGFADDLEKKPRFLERFKDRWVTRRKIEIPDNWPTIQEPKRPGLFRKKGRFFSLERIKERHDFRIKVSANRKWIMVGVAVLAVCITVIYLSITYGGGVLKGLF